MSAKAGCLVKLQWLGQALLSTVNQLLEPGPGFLPPRNAPRACPWLPSPRNAPRACPWLLSPREFFWSLPLVPFPPGMLLAPQTQQLSGLCCHSTVGLLFFLKSDHPSRKEAECSQTQELLCSGQGIPKAGIQV